MLWEPNIVLVVELHVVRVCMCWGWLGGVERLSEPCDQTQISSDVHGGGDEVIFAPRQCGAVRKSHLSLI